MAHRKKTSLFIISSLFAFAVIFGAVLFVYNQNVITYSAPDEPIFLAASFEETDTKDLENWETEILNRKSTPSVERSSYTESIAKSALTEYFKAKNANAAVNEEEIAKTIIQNSSLNNLERKIEFVEYQIDDIKIISNTNAETLRKYGNELGTASIKNVYDRTYGNEFEIFNRSMQTNDPLEFEKLKPIISNYENLIADLANIEVPADTAMIHLNIINSLSAMNGGVKEFNIFLTDPIRGLFVLGKYANYALELQNNMKKLDSIMKKNGVNFTNTDPGYVIEKAANVSL